MSEKSSKYQAVPGSQSSKKTFDLTKEDTFVHWTTVTLRFSDQDSLGHVNNVAYSAFVEAARTNLISEVLSDFNFKNINFVLVQITINFIREMHYPGLVEVGAVLSRMGSKSFSSAFGLFNNSTCVATAESTNVFFDTVTRKAIKPPLDVREAIQIEINKGI